MLLPILFLLNSISIITQTPNIIQYNITLDKSLGTGIYSFELSGVYNGRAINYSSSYENCSITTAIYCEASFVIEPGIYTNIIALKDGIPTTTLPLPTPLNTSMPSTQQGVVTTIVVNSGKDFEYALVALGSIAIIIIVGNLIYYFKKRDELIWK